MPVFSPKDLANWAGGSWTSEPKGPIKSVGHDTRTLNPGALYVALPGERVDGHDLIAKALEAGAVAVLSLEGKDIEGLPCLEVKDTGKALEHIARGYRKTLHPKHLIGVTGSAGKTTVKDFISIMLSQAGPTCSTKGNWNNFVGLPLSLLSMDPSDTFGVFEMGMNHAGEIKALGDILKPQMGLITSIGEAHLEQLGSVEAIAKEKTSLLANLPSDGLAVLDQDSSWFSYTKSRCACPFVTVSLDLNSSADIQGNVQGNSLLIKDQKRKLRFSVPLPLPGDHMVRNLLQAVAMVLECAVTPKQIVAGLENYQSAPMRWQELEVAGRTIINDAYNANPLSMRKSLQTFSELHHSGGKWAVLGGMAELGSDAEVFHKELGRDIDTLGFDGVLLIGEKANWIGSSITKTEKIWVLDNKAAASFLNANVPKTCVLLLKGSRSERLEQILQELEKSEEDKL